MNIQQMMKQAQALQKKMVDMQQNLEEMEVVGSSGGGMVQITSKANGEAKSIKIDKELLNPEEVEVLEDLIIAAFNNAKNNSKQLMDDEMKKLGISPEMMKMPF